MSDRSRNQQSEGLKLGNDIEPTDLSELKAHKSLHKEGVVELRAQHPGGIKAAVDLSDMSIQTDTVTRFDRRERRTPPTALTSTAPRLSPGIERALTEGKTKKPESAPPCGIIKNPHYSYSGNLLSRIIQFLANILKVLERILLTALYGRKAQAVRQRAAIRSPEQTTKTTPPPKNTRGKRSWLLRIIRGG